MGDNGTEDFLSQFKKYVLENKDSEALSFLAQKTNFLSKENKCLSHFGQGVLHYKRGEDQLALIHFRKAEPITSLKEDIEYYKANIFYNIGQPKRAFESIKKISENFKAEKNGEVEYLKGLVLLKLNKPQEALTFLDPLIRKWRRHEKRPYLLDALLRHALMTTEYSKTIYCRWFNTLYTDHPDHPTSRAWSLSSDKYSVKDFKVSCSTDLKDKRSRLFTSFRKGMSEKIEADLNTFTDEDEANELKVDFYYLSGEMEKAVELFKNVHGKKLNSSPQLLKKLSRYNYYAGNYEDSLSEYQRVVDLYSRSRSKAYHLYYLSKLNLNLNNHVATEDAIDKISQRYKNTSYFKSSRWYKSWNYFLDNKYEEAFLGFNELLKEIQKNRLNLRGLDEEKVLYWMARSLEKSGEVGRAAAVYKKVNDENGPSYYSLLSSLRLKKIFKNQGADLEFEDILNPPWRSVSEDSLQKIANVYQSIKLSTRTPSALLIGLKNSGESLVDENVISLPNNIVYEVGSEEKRFSEELSRYSHFADLGFLSEASEVLTVLERRSETKKFKETLLSNFKNINDYKNLSLSTLRYFNEQRYSSDAFVANKYWKYAYPKAFDEEVSAESEKFGVPKSLVWAHMRAESFYDSKAMSPVGAQGLLQIMPYTAEKLLNIELNYGQRQSASANIEFKTQSQFLKNLMNPELNIKMGSAYLGRLKKVFSNYFPLMAAAYNGGPHRVKLWSSQFGDVELDEFIERIPFSETQNYVKKIIFYNYVYTSLYDHNNSYDDFYRITEPLKYFYSGPHPTKESWEPI